MIEKRHLRRFKRIEEQYEKFKIKYPNCYKQDNGWVIKAHDSDKQGMKGIVEQFLTITSVMLQKLNNYNHNTQIFAVAGDDLSDYYNSKIDINTLNHDSSLILMICRTHTINVLLESHGSQGLIQDIKSTVISIQENIVDEFKKITIRNDKSVGSDLFEFKG